MKKIGTGRKEGGWGVSKITPSAGIWNPYDIVP